MTNAQERQYNLHRNVYSMQCHPYYHDQFDLYVKYIYIHIYLLLQTIYQAMSLEKQNMRLRLLYVI